MESLNCRNEEFFSQAKDKNHITELIQKEALLGNALSPMWPMQTYALSAQIP